MKNLLCTNPAIILNRHCKDLVLRYGNYTIRGEFFELTSSERSIWCYSFPYHKFGTKRLHITREDVDTCYITDFETGEQIPLYFEVPCNKCVLCRDKKARDWSTRGMCESQMSISKPWFITLTYNDTHLPSEGLCKKHCQNFMKRFRMNAERYFGYALNLRFFLCGEYGSKTHRPHYHLLLWNLPLIECSHLEKLVDKSWSFVIPKKNVSSYPKKLVHYDEIANRYRVTFGFSKILSCEGNHIKYSMKYMRKDCVKPDSSASDTFYLASRRRGIGYGWLDVHKDEILNNPHYNDIQFNDMWSGKPFKASIPRYFKDILHPCISKVLPRDIRDKFSRYVYLINVRNSIINKRIVYTPEFRVFAKYSPLYAYVQEITSAHFKTPYLMELEEDYAYYQKEETDGFLLNIHRVSVPPCDSPDEKINILCKKVVFEIEALEKELQSYPFDCASFLHNQELKHNHNYWQLKEILASPWINVNDYAWSVNRECRLRKLAETF